MQRSHALSNSDQKESPSAVTFHYVKSNHFRVIHVDGGYGGFTPNGGIFLSIYNERSPLPDVTVQAVEEGQLGKEIVEQRKGSEGIIRELEIGLVMDVRVAASIVEWLTARIQMAQQIQEKQKSQAVESE